MKIVTITQANSYSKIQGLSPEHEKELRSVLSYSIGDFFSGYGPRRKSLLSKRNEFPTGLLHRVENFLWSEKISHRFINDRIRPPPAAPIASLKESCPSPYPFQLEAAKYALSHERGIIEAVTGSGKSLIIALIASRLNLETIVVVPSLEIKKQLTASLKDALLDTSKITVENIDSTALQTPSKHFDCLIIDEAHHVAASTYQKLNKNQWKGIYYRFFLTATPFRNDAEQTLLFEGLAGQVVYSYDYHKAVQNAHIVPVEAYYYSVPKQKTDAYTWSQVYSELVVNNTVRNELIALMLLKLEAARLSTLCLVKEVEHGRILAELTGLPFIHGQDESSRDYIRQFNSGGINCLIGTTGVIGEGVDTKPCEYVIVAGLGKAKSQFMQVVGRGVRRYGNKQSCKVILFEDKSHKFTSRHFKEQKKILVDEYSVIAIKLEMQE